MFPALYVSIVFEKRCKSSQSGACPCLCSSSNIFDRPCSSAASTSCRRLVQVHPCTKRSGSPLVLRTASIPHAVSTGCRNIAREEDEVFSGTTQYLPQRLKREANFKFHSERTRSSRRKTKNY